jgi:putative hydrolase of the HAD superfamily
MRRDRLWRTRGWYHRPSPAALAGPATIGRVRDLGGVLFDMGGVVMESPLHALARYERERGLPANSINRVIAAAGEAGAWARLERGELTAEAFCAPFEADCRARGLDVDGRAIMAAIAAVGVARPIMLEAIRRIRARGLRVGALTNNWRRAGPDDDVIPHRLREHFDVFIESRVVGLRKPDPLIYRLACRELGVEPPRTAFLDDIGANLKPARALGMTTIKVDDPEQALRELGALLDLDLVN